MDPSTPQPNPSEPTAGGQTTGGQASGDPASRSEARERAPAQTVVVRSSALPVILLLVLCGALGVGLLLSLAFNIYSAAAYAQYFQTDAKVMETHHSGERFANNKIAIVSIEGVMLDSEGFAKKQIDRVRDDENVKAIVLRINSPGGAVSVADYLYHYLQQVRDERNIPVVVSMGSVAASGGYYVAMTASDEERVIFCEPTGITGSIGVIIPRYDISGLLKEWNIESDSIVSHEFKELGSWTEELTPEERRRLQSQVDLLFNRFKDIVKQGRPELDADPNALDQVATGEVFTGLKAKELMLVDETGFIEDAIERAAELAKLKQENYRVVQYKSPPTLADALTGSVEAPRHPLDTKQLLDMTTPRAYYLYSSLPGLVAE